MYKNLIFLLALAPISAYSATKITVHLDSTANAASNGAIEACGTAVHSDGIKPLLISINHNGANYTALTNESGKWCILFRRSTYDGQFDISASTMDFKDKTSLLTIR